VGAAVAGRGNCRWLVKAVGTAAVAGWILIAPSPAVVAGPAPPSTGATAALGTIWALDSQSIVGYPPGSNGSIAPTITIAGSKVGLGLADDLVVDPSGALWVSDADRNQIEEFGPGAKGNVAPALKIRGSKTRLHSPTGLAMASNGNLWVLNDDSSDATASLIEFAAGAHGNVAPIAEIAGPKARLFPSFGIAVSRRGNELWVTHAEAGSGLNSPAVQEFATTTPGNVTATRTIAGAHTRLGFPYGVLVDSGGDLVVADDGAGGSASSLLTFAPKATGNVAPIRVISGATTGIVEPSYVGMDAVGNVWEPNFQANSLGRFASGATGDVAAGRTIVGTRTGLADPNAVAVYSTKPGAPRALAASQGKHRRLELTWRTPADNGGGLLGYRLLQKTSTHGHWSLAAKTTRPSFVTGKFAKHRHLWFVVEALNADGVSTPSVRASVIVS
jgi:hypothetical protein